MQLFLEKKCFRQIDNAYFLFNLLKPKTYIMYHQL